MPAASLDDVLPHDLLEIGGAGALLSDGPIPGWVAASLARAPFVVARRAPRRAAALPVGVRGATRGERFAAWLPAGAGVRRIRPEDLASARGWTGRGELPFGALDAVAALMGALRLSWGPTGSVGFELASGVATATAASDLDLVARAPAPLPRDAVLWLRARLAALPCRADLQLETPAGAVALDELVADRPRRVVRTAEGPRRLADPWGATAEGRGR